MLSIGRKLQYKGFAFDIARDSIYQLLAPTYRCTNTTKYYLSGYDIFFYSLSEDTAEQFQTICFGGYR